MERVIMTMVEAMSSKKQSLLRSTSLVSLMTLFSRIMGFARDMIIAQLFGAQAGMDAFYMAFKIPNFMRRLFAEGAFAQAFVPVLAEYQKTKTIDEVRSFLARIAGSMSAVLTAVTLFGVVFAPWVIEVFAPGFGSESARSVLASQLLRLTFPYLMFISLTAMAGAVLNTYGYFGVPAFTPVFLNISLIIAALYVSPHFAVPVAALAWGVLIAGIVQLSFQIPFLFKHKFLVRPALGFHDSGVKRVLKLMGPALFGVSIAQINLLVDTVFASFLQVGSVTWLFYTDRLTDFPLGVFGVAIATVILPHLSRQNKAEESAAFSRALDWGLRLLLLVGVPAGVALSFFSMPMIASCFAYGKFTAFDVLQTQRSLITLSLGLPAFMLVKVLASGFYAHQDIKTPVKIGAFVMLLNTLLCALFIGHFAHAGLTLASALASYANCALLFWLLKRRKHYQPRPGWLRFFIQVAVANGMMGLYLLMMKGTLHDWMDMSAIWRLGLLGAHLLVSALIYLIVLRISGVSFAHFRGQIKE